MSDFSDRGGKADEIDAELARLGYRCLHLSVDAVNCARGDDD